MWERFGTLYKTDWKSGRIFPKAKYFLFVEALEKTSLTPSGKKPIKETGPYQS